MPNDIANNMADTIHQLEEDRIMLNTQLADLQFAYNEQMLELKEAKRLLKLAVEDFKKINSDMLTCKYCKWYSADHDECAYFPDDTPCEKICGWKHEGEALRLIES